MSNAGNGYDVQAGSGNLIYPNGAYNPALGAYNPALSGLSPQFGSGLGTGFNNGLVSPFNTGLTSQLNTGYYNTQPSIAGLKYQAQSCSGNFCIGVSFFPAVAYTSPLTKFNLAIFSNFKKKSHMGSNVENIDLDLVMGRGKWSQVGLGME